MINGFKKTNFILIFILFISFNVFSQQKAQYRLGITYGSSLYSNKEQFEFTLSNGQKVILNSTNPAVYFTSKFARGQNYSITQTAGSRTCDLGGMNQGVFSNQDIVVSANCGNPPLSIFKLQTIGIEQGEVFKFADNYRRTHQYPFSTTANLGGYPQGDDYSITQTGGPRQCKMTNNQGIVPNTPLTIQADCRKNPIETTPTPSISVEFDLVSRSTDNKKFGTFYDSNSPDIGGIGADEGRYITFVSSAVGLGNSTGKYRQIIWRDRKTGETRLVSQGMNGVEGNQNSFAPAISADGKSVAFESYATNLVPIDSNNVRDVFVWNYDKSTVTAVSDAPGGIEANSEAFEPSISGDGRFIVFSSSASTLTSGVDGTSTVNLFLKDMQSGTVTLISRDPKTGKGGGGSRGSISEDGSRIAFYNYFPLTSDDKNTLWDIYVWDRGNPKLKRISLTAGGMERDQGTESSSRVITPAISGNGRFVTFATTAKNMFPGDSNGLQDAFMVEIDTGKVSPLSFVNGNFGNGDSPVGQGEKIPITFDGNQVIFTSKAANLGGSLLIQNLTEGTSLRVVTPKKNADGVEFSIGVPAISRTGKCVVFGSNIKLDKRFPSSGIFVTCFGN